MLILAKSALALLIGFITSVTFGYFFIKFLKRVNIRQTVSVFLEERHKKKEGIPTMGGFIFIIPTDSYCNYLAFYEQNRIFK